MGRPSPYPGSSPGTPPYGDSSEVWVWVLFTLPAGPGLPQGRARQPAKGQAWPRYVASPQHRHELHQAIRQRERDHLDLMPAPLDDAPRLPRPNVPGP
jgi:hypothetical protein